MWELNRKESWALKNWFFWTVMLVKTLESPLQHKEMQPVYPKGDQSWVFIGRTDAEAETPKLWPPDVKNWLIGRDPDSGKNWKQEKGMREDECMSFYHSAILICRSIDAFELWCWRRHLRVLWTARRWNPSVLKEISPEYSLEGLMLKLKLQNFGHLMWRTDSLEKTLMLGKIEGRRRGDKG